MDRLTHSTALSILNKTVRESTQVGVDLDEARRKYLAGCLLDVFRLLDHEVRDYIPPYLRPAEVAIFGEMADVANTPTPSTVHPAYPQWAIAQAGMAGRDALRVALDAIEHHGRHGHEVRGR